MRAKLGITSDDPNDISHIEEFLNSMEKNKSDYTNSFPRLPQNPAVIPRNHRVEEALTAAESGDFSVMHNLLSALRNPFKQSEKYSQPPTPACCDYKTFCGT
jgi:uncharacterized protein YdiU (UPF0061 family)